MHRKKIAKDNEKLKNAQKIIDRAKTAAEHIMAKLDTDMVQAGSFQVEKKTRKMERINKKICPHDIWRTYSKLYTYHSFFLKMV